MSSSEVERFTNDLKTQPELRDAVKQHAESMANVVSFAGSRGYSFTVEEAKECLQSRAGTELDDAQLDAATGGAFDTYMQYLDTQGEYLAG